MSDFSKEELNVLRQLIHFAVQGRGMEVAEAGVILTKKINALLEREQKMDTLVANARQPEQAPGNTGALLDG